MIAIALLYSFMYKTFTQKAQSRAAGSLEDFVIHSSPVEFEPRPANSHLEVSVVK